MLLSIEVLSETPIYLQISHEIIKAIAKGELKTSDELPSVRSLGSDLGVNLHTINKAYNTLKQEGFLIVNRRRGVVVNDPIAYASNPTYLEGLKMKLESTIIESVARGVDQEMLQNIVLEIIDSVKGGV